MRHVPAHLAILSLAAVAFAGCLGAGPPTGDDAAEAPAVTWTEEHPLLSQPIWRDILKEHHPVPSSLDGKLLDNWVFRPDTPDDVKVPVFIDFSPYYTNLKPSAESGGATFNQYLIDYFLPRGYAIVLASARGTGYSEGCFNLGGAVEQQDTYDVIEHFANQPWSNGNVGAGGKSYDGTIPNGVAVLAPPGLKTIFPVSPISELYKYNYKAGVSYGQGTIFNAYYYAIVGMDALYGQPKTSHPTLLVDSVACPWLPEMQAWGVASGLIGDSSDYWEERNYTRTAANAQAAMWLVHGLQDWNVKPDHILPWMTEYGGPVKAWLHQWTDRCCGGHVFPMREDWNVTMLRWLDHWLKDIDTGIMDEPAVQVQDTLGRWRHEATWPPADAAPQPFPVQVGTFVDDGSRGTATGGANAGFLRTAIDAPERGLHIAGEAALKLRIASDQPQGRLIAYLWDVDPEGSVTMVTHGSLNLRHRDGIQDPQPVLPGTAYDVTLVFHPADAALPADHTLVLTVAGSGPAYLTVATEATLTVSGGNLWLPLKTAPLVLEDPVPVPTARCWAC